MPSSLQFPKGAKRHWRAAPQVTAWLEARIAPAARVLEIGPSAFRFERADMYVDLRPIIGIPSDKFVSCNILTEPLPFADKEFDFVYCRHVLEDLYDPFPICREMSRVAKAGYIETPSPICELCAGVDGDSGMQYRGYHHHHWIIWEHTGELRFVSKYPIIEYAKMDDNWIVNGLSMGSKYWNTHYLWEGSINAKPRIGGIDYECARDYPMVLQDALKQGRSSADEFWAQGIDKIEITVKGLERAYA